MTNTPSPAKAPWRHPVRTESQKAQTRAAMFKGLSVNTEGGATGSDLLTKIKMAVKAVNEAEKTAETAKTELVSRSKEVGLLLLEAKKLHPAVRDFEAFLKKVKGLKLARAYDCMAFASGRKTEAENREAIRNRVKKHRAKKLPKPTPAPQAEPEPISVTSPHVTESPEISVEQRKAQHANLDSAESSTKAYALDDPLDDSLVRDIDDEFIEATPWFASKIKPIFDGSIKNDEAESALALVAFKRACATFLPQLTIKDLEAAQNIFSVVIRDLEHDVKNDKFQAKFDAADAKRIKWEASHPKEAKNKARERAQSDAMEYDKEEAKAEAREDGESWGDVKDEWIDEWVANNWGAEQEAGFEEAFQKQWTREHGVEAA
jgi:hypothetical protein